MAEREFEALKERIAGKRIGFTRVSCINATLPLSQILSSSDDLCSTCKVLLVCSIQSSILSLSSHLNIIEKEFPIVYYWRKEYTKDAYHWHCITIYIRQITHLESIKHVLIVFELWTFTWTFFFQPHLGAFLRVPHWIFVEWIIYLFES